MGVVKHSVKRHLWKESLQDCFLDNSNMLTLIFVILTSIEENKE